ncbi:MAG: AmmeMemoRadiSam system protein A [Acidobacteriota bacterium]
MKDVLSRESGRPPLVILDIARDSLTAHLKGRPYEPPLLPPPWDAPRPVFVTLRSPEQALRGCIGHLEPITASLSREVASCAVAAAIDDPRFPPVVVDELPGLDYEVSLLEPPAPVRFEDLDPKRFGIIVSSGRRQGVLLPDVEGVETPEEQLRIALDKGAILPREPYKLERFRVLKVD